MRKKIFSKTVIIFLLVSVCISFSACGESRKAQSQIAAMDTIMTLTAYGNKADDGLKAAESVISALASEADPDIETSTCYKINHANGDQVVVSGMIADMLITAQSVYEQSGGCLDLTIYPLIVRWGFTNGKYYVPSDVEISEDMARFCMDKMLVSTFPLNGTYAVQLPSYGELSFAACAKGCASKYAVDAMSKAGVKSGIVSLGGNVQTLGLKPDGSEWRVGITDPNNPGSYLATISVGQIAVVTSGSYQRYMPNNPKYHHIFNPKTGYPANNGLKSVTIVCEDGTMADCLSTAMFVAGKTAALSYWKTYGDFEMIMITDSNEIIATKGLIEKMELANPNYSLSFYE